VGNGEKVHLVGNHHLKDIYRHVDAKVTGKMIRAGRVFADITQEELAVRAGIHRDVVRGWEGSSDAAPKCQYRTLSRVISALEAEGVRFSENGVSHEGAPRATPIEGTVIHSEARQ
jgi:transcriptional regulator with XRE-family HTH domain